MPADDRDAPGGDARPPGQGRSLRILVVSNLYPTAEHPAFGTFVAARVDALRRAGADVDVVAIRDPGVHRAIARKYLRLTGSILGIALSRAASRRRYDFVEAHIAVPTGWFAWPAAVLHRARLVLFVHGADVADVARRSPLHRAATRFIFARAAMVVVNSQYMAAETARVLSVEPPRLVVWSPGIDLTAFAHPGGDEGAGPRDGILFVGRLARQKGVAELVEAVGTLAAKGRSVPLAIIGDGPARDELTAIARAASSPIHVLGPQPPAAVAAAMRRCAVLVVPSAYGEALGLVALEGMAAGAIVVAARTGGLVETVIEGETGLAFTPGDAGDLAVVLEQALDLAADPAARAALASRARAMAARHGVDDVARASLEVYRSVLESRA